MPAAGGILALDLSLSTGWAYGCAEDASPVSGYWVLPPTARGLGACYVALENELEDAIHLHRPALVAVEAPLVWKRQTSAELLLGLANIAEACCWRWDVECRKQSVESVRTAVIGTSRFPKGEAKTYVLDWCRRRGWDLDNDDEADARVLWQHNATLIRNRRWRATTHPMEAAP